MDAKLTKVDKNELLSIENPQYEHVKAKYPHLAQVNLTDNNKKDQLPIHVISSVGDYARIKTNRPPVVGEAGEPVAEYTKQRRFIMSPGNEIDRQTMFLTQTSHVDYEELCRLDVLGLKDSTEHDQDIVHAEFKDQLVKDAQLQEGIVEEAHTTVTDKEFYIPHKGMVKESSETTKLQVVYDASAKEDPSSPSLNECLYPGTPLQNKLWDVLIQQRAFPVMVSSDICQAFLQIRIKAAERDALRFHWCRDDLSPLKTLRFTRVLFGLVPSPYLLHGVIETHLDIWSKTYLEEVEHLRRSMYVDDLLSGGLTVDQPTRRKEISREILQDATFELHKWSSNVPQLEVDEVHQVSEFSDEQSYAKTQLMVKPKESKVLV
ncbi:Hypothetical predicted protein [Paramuricea clavata]|uniref:Uncharacterized protein n=1 Tax=Paramuricea clavata TaxID=317549 RepID=A0A7D9HF21_PARCT|nr:Hypothetical predicted protein [Paramuricea clavata]